MAIQTLSYKTDSDVVKTEGKNRYSRDEWQLPANFGSHPVGTVLSKVTATGIASVLVPGAATGAEKPLAILLEEVTVGTDPKVAVVLARHAEVVLQAIVWPVGITAPQKTAALAALAERGIVARNGV
jgi:hypothetical protein